MNQCYYSVDIVQFLQARLWVQIMRELRHGVHLKKAQHHQHAAPVEYELTPFEVLLEDIRTRRYTLNKIMVSVGDSVPHNKAIVLQHTSVQTDLLYHMEGF